MDKQEKLTELEAVAKARGYELSKDSTKILDAMFKKEKKLGGLYCPCKNVSIMDDDEKKLYTCPCASLDADIKENGECFCGMFVRPGTKV